MSINNKLNALFRNRSSIVIVLALVSMLAVIIYSSISAQQLNAFDINELSNFTGLSGLSLDNNCITLDYNNLQTVDNRTTFSNNQDSPNC